MYRYAGDDHYMIEDLTRPGTFIPPDERNADYRAVLAWVAEGNVIAEPLLPPSIALDPSAENLDLGGSIRELVETGL